MSGAAFRSRSRDPMRSTGLQIDLRGILRDGADAFWGAAKSSKALSGGFASS